MKLKKLIITFFLLPAAFGYAQTQSTQIIAHRGFLENQWFGTKFHSRTDESRFCRLLRF